MVSRYWTLTISALIAIQRKPVYAYYFTTLCSWRKYKIQVQREFQLNAITFFQRLFYLFKLFPLTQSMLWHSVIKRTRSYQEQSTLFITSRVISDQTDVITRFNEQERSHGGRPLFVPRQEKSGDVFFEQGHQNIIVSRIDFNPWVHEAKLGYTTARTHTTNMAPWGWDTFQNFVQLSFVCSPLNS